MENHRGLFRVAAIASLLSAVTTAILIYGPDAPLATDLAASAQLHDDPLYLYKRWVLFFHPQFAFTASVGIAFALFRKAPALISIGLFYLATWAITEMTQQALTIDALNQYWRPAFLDAAGTPEAAAYVANLKGFEGLSDSLYFVLLFGFGTGTLVFGLAFLRAGNSTAAYPEYALGLVLVLIGLLSLCAFIGYYAGLDGIVPITNWIYAHLYGVLQTGVRIALGVWLWFQATSVTSGDGAPSATG